jgi:hypothetical protein
MLGQPRAAVRQLNRCEQLPVGITNWRNGEGGLAFRRLANSAYANREVRMQTFRVRSLLATLLLTVAAAHPSASIAATFSYHGSLQDGGKPAQGAYDLELTLYSAASGGRPIGGPLLLYRVPVSGGSFSTQADFGPLSNLAGTAWLGVKLRPAGNGEFAALAARAPVTADATASVCPGAWTTSGNAGTTPGTGLGQNYLGTADNQPLVIAVKGAQAARMAASGDANHPDSTNVVLGSPGNFVGAGIGGATVGGGGSSQFTNCGPLGNQPCVNTAIGPFSTVAGGYGNNTPGDTAAIAGGAFNYASGAYSMIGGGSSNGAAGFVATVSGGAANFATGDFAFVGGGEDNYAFGTGSTIGGGGTFTPSNCGPTGDQGCGNSATGAYATVAGGLYSRALQDYDTVGGGARNSATGGFSTVAGGDTNTAGGKYSSVGGGGGNTASGDHATVAGGANNTAGGTYSATGSGAGNVAGGDFSYAAGYQAKVQNAAEAHSAADCANNVICGDFLTFVWSDGNNGVPFTSTGPQQFLIHAAGGVAINTTPPNNFIELTIAGSGNSSDYANAFLRQAGNNSGVLISSGGATSTANNDAVFSIDRYNGAGLLHDLSFAGNGDFTIYSANAVKPTGTTWSNPSDGRLKRDVRALENTLDRVLQLRGVTFEYSNPDSYLHPAGRHTGFIAQEVQQVFPDWIGSTPDGYLTVGPNGFEAMTVEALRDLRTEKDAAIALLQDKLDTAAGKNAAMQARLDDLSERLSKLEAGRER